MSCLKDSGLKNINETLVAKRKCEKRPDMTVSSHKQCFIPRCLRGLQLMIQRLTVYTTDDLLHTPVLERLWSVKEICAQVCIISLFLPSVIKQWCTKRSSLFNAANNDVSVILLEYSVEFGTSPVCCIGIRADTGMTLFSHYVQQIS